MMCILLLSSDEMSPRVDACLLFNELTVLYIGSLEF